MDRRDQLAFLIDALLAEMPEYREQAGQFPPDDTSQRGLLRSLMNVRPPMPLDRAFLEVQDALLSAETEEKGVVDGDALPPTAGDARLVLWQGDITRLRADAVVDADNAALLGCFVPCHGCIDNAIHTYAGMQLRLECAEIMRKQGHEEETGHAKITGGYNLPCRYVLHTVGPIVSGTLTKEHEQQLASCYRSCLDLAAENNCESLAFCCISTGEFHFPNEKAAEIAVETVKQWQARHPQQLEVIFNVFKNSDREIYEQLLG